MQVTDQHGQWNIGRAYSSHSPIQGRIQVHGISTDNTIYGPLVVQPVVGVEASTSSSYERASTTVVHWISSDNITGLSIQCASGGMNQIRRAARASAAPLCNNVACSDNPSCCRQEQVTGTVSCCDCCASSWETCINNHTCIWNSKTKVLDSANETGNQRNHITIN